MTYGGGEFRHDVFVSYSHGARYRAGERPKLKRWSDSFYRDFLDELGYSTNSLSLSR